MGEGGLDVDSLSTDTPGLSAAEAAAAAAEADAAMSAAGLNAVDNPEAAQAAMDAAAADVAGYDLGDYGDMASPSRASSAELGALEETGLIGYNDKVALGFLDTLERENRQSDINLARSIADKYGLDLVKYNRDLCKTLLLVLKLQAIQDREHSVQQQLKWVELLSG